MAGTGHENALSQNTVDELNHKVTDPSFFCGGGSVAALTASNAAALTLLVMGLSAGRKANRKRKADIERQIGDVESLQQRLYAAADSDLDVLDELLRTQRHTKKTGDRSGYQAALFAAAQSPYRICQLCFELLEIIEAQLTSASRFTVSDLGAAAALAMGAIQGAILTTDVNVALLRDETNADADQIDILESDSLAIVSESRAIADRIVTQTAMAIRRSPKAGQS